MRVLIGCEFSGTVRDAFLAKGHDAWSNDILPAKGPHIEGDIFAALHADYWDLVILHPPCTHMAVSGNRWYAGTSARDQAIEWTLNLWNDATKICDRVCLEQPISVLPLKPKTYVHPWEHGHGEVKKTTLYLHNLPALVPTNIVEGRDERIWRMPPGEQRSQERSRFYPGIAAAMAEQWGN